MYSKHELLTIGKSFQNIYSNECIINHYSKFEWRGKQLPEGWKIRVNLSSQLQHILSIPDIWNQATMNGFREVAQSIHVWGFGRNIPSHLKENENFWTDLKNVLKTFNDKNSNDVSKFELLTNLLNYPGIGIATASKWICFVDQNRFAIYDSRVSIAMRDVLVDSTHRAFPIIPRRAKAGNKIWPTSSLVSDSKKIAVVYLDYIKLLDAIKQKIELQPAQIEMALFMAGNIWPKADSRLAPLKKRNWTVTNQVHHPSKPE